MSTATFLAPLAVREPRAAAWLGRLTARLVGWAQSTAAQAPLMLHGVNPEASPPAPTRTARVEVR